MSNRSVHIKYVRQPNTSIRHENGKKKFVVSRNMSSNDMIKNKKNKILLSKRSSANNQEKWVINTHTNTHINTHTNTH